MSLKKDDCEEEKWKREEEDNKKKAKEIKEHLDICKSLKCKYGKESWTLLELIKHIQKEKKDNVEEFLLLFPETGLKEFGDSRSHVFESLWIIIFILKLDDLIINAETKRIIYNSLEDEKEELNYKDKSVLDYFKKTNVNTGHEGGIVDLYFEDSNFNKQKEITQGYACENKCENQKRLDKKNDKENTIKYLYSSKFFRDDKKKGIGSFDIEKIFTEAIMKFNREDCTFKIGIFARDISVIFDKCARSQKSSTNILDKNISYGQDKLNIYYKRLITYLDNCDLKTENPFKDIIPPKTQINIKFHQKLFIQFTNNNIEKKNYKYIWGAVPRSGKSYMIGGLIAERKPKNVLIILGAVSETHAQFSKMFEDYKGSFGDYNIVDISEEKTKKNKFDKINEKGKKYRYCKSTTIMAIKRKKTNKLYQVKCHNKR